MSVRYLIFAAIFAVSFILLQNWSAFSEHKFAQQQQQKINQATNTQATSTNAIGENIPVETPHLGNQDIPILEKQTPSTTTTTLSTSTDSKYVISVENDVLLMNIDLRGGDIVYAALKKQKKTLNAKQNFVLIERSPLRTYIMQSGLIGNNGTDSSQGRAIYHSAQKHYQLQPGQQQLNIDLQLQQASGAQIIKRFTIKPHQYLIGLQYLVNNTSNSLWTGAMYGQIKRDNSEDPSAQHGGGLGLKPFLGYATTTDEERFEKFSYKQIEKQKFEQNHSDGWIALIQHYFLSAWIPNNSKAYNYSIFKTNDNFFIGRFTGSVKNIAVGQQDSFNAQIYLGPKDQYRLKEISPGLELSVDYSFLWWIAQPLYSLLSFFSTGRLHMFGIDKQIFSGFGNWGISIILLTILVKLLFFKLNQKAYRSMGKMKKFAPKMKSIKDRFPDDRQKQSQAMMELYKKEKINPMGGCLPMLVQMPVFLALYWVLMESVELRHAPFFGWIEDLSTRDPLFILPLIMGISMWFQQKLNPKPADPMQAKVMQWLPVIFSVFFLFFPAGLVLYWVVNNILSITQQWIITRQLEREDKQQALGSA